MPRCRPPASDDLGFGPVVVGRCAGHGRYRQRACRKVGRCQPGRERDETRGSGSQGARSKSTARYLGQLGCKGWPYNRPASAHVRAQQCAYDSREESSDSQALAMQNISAETVSEPFRAKEASESERTCWTAPRISGTPTLPIPRMALEYERAGCDLQRGHEAHGGGSPVHHASAKQRAFRTILSLRKFQVQRKCAQSAVALP